MIPTQSTSYSEFLGLTDEQLPALQVKITYVGEQRKLLPSLVIVGPGNLDAEPKILGVTAPGLDFGNDRIARSVHSASVEELRGILDALGQFPNIRNGGGDHEFSAATRDALLVMSLLHFGNERERRLSIALDPIDAEFALDAMSTPLLKNKECRNHLFILWRALGFHIGRLDPDSDNDGASDGREASRGTDPNAASSAGDGVLDGDRIILGLDPLNPLQPIGENPRSFVRGGPFDGSRIVETTTSPERTSGVVEVEFSYTPSQDIADAERLLFMQTFRRLGRKANGIQVAFAPSLYLVYAGSPELDQVTIDGETIDHKVGELDPYYNGDDPHDVFSAVPHKQRPGMKVNREVRSARMLYRARTYEHHWRLLNPEGIAEVQFDYETAVFCDAGPTIGQFLGVAEWRWGKKRGARMSADILRAEPVNGPPNSTIRVVGDGGDGAADVYTLASPGQPSADYLKVLALWNHRHKFALPGPSVRVEDGVLIRIPQPVMTSTTLQVSAITPPSTTPTLTAQGLRASRFARAIVALADGGPAWEGFFPFCLPVTLTFTYRDTDVVGLDESHLGVGWVDTRTDEVTCEGINILSRSTAERSIMFTTDRLGSFVIVGRSSV